MHYMRKINTRDQYLLVSEHKNIYNELSALLSKQDELLVWKDRYNKTNFNTAELRLDIYFLKFSLHWSICLNINLDATNFRYILGKMEVSGDYIDEILI